ncbi:hypothetical protein AMELA_G00159460, partial [Ameiurus melas]
MIICLFFDFTFIGFLFLSWFAVQTVYFWLFGLCLFFIFLTIPLSVILDVINLCTWISTLQSVKFMFYWYPVQGVPCLVPDDSWDRLQVPHDPEEVSGRRWMDGWKFMSFN